MEAGSAVDGIGRGDGGAVRRLHRQHRKERLVVGVAAVASRIADVRAQMLDQQVTPGIGLVAP